MAAVQRKVTFRIVLPGWLPKGMHLTRVYSAHLSTPSTNPALLRRMMQAILDYNGESPSGKRWSFSVTEMRGHVNVIPNNLIRYDGLTLEKGQVNLAGVGASVWDAPYGVAYLVTGYQFVPEDVLVHINASLAHKALALSKHSR